ncbi:MAG: hypothetical protein CSB55_08875 [Candidatus Cloacimonadota bacterium]|nr:MAG: hypothetical protein CSB55_08875 [Candidatus Cloacimonadota bacterium]
MIKRLFFALFLILYFSFLRAQNIYPPDSEYTEPDEVLEKLQNWADSHSDIFYWTVLGYTEYGNNPIYGIKISDNPNLEEPGEPALLFCGPHQSEELLGTEIIFAEIEKALELYYENDTWKNIIDNREIWFVPYVNADGFQVVNGGKYHLKRKNFADTNENFILEPDDGVDLNKNYPFNWEYDENTYPESPYYKGKAPESEREIQIMTEFFDKQRFVFAVFYHSSATGAFAEKIFYPWVYENDISPDFYYLKQTAEFISRFLPKDYESGNYDYKVHKNSKRGFARDYIYSEYQTMPLTIEVGGVKDNIAIIRPGNDQLTKIKKKHTEAFIEITKKISEEIIAVKSNLKPDSRLLAEESFHPSVKGLKTDKFGYAYRCFPKSIKQYNLSFNGHKIKLLRKNKNVFLKFPIEESKEIYQVFNEEIFVSHDFFEEITDSLSPEIIFHRQRKNSKIKGKFIKSGRYVIIDSTASENKTEVNIQMCKIITEGYKYLTHYRNNDPRYYALREGEKASVSFLTADLNNIKLTGLLIRFSPTESGRKIKVRIINDNSQKIIADTVCTVSLRGNMNIYDLSLPGGGRYSAEFYPADGKEIQVLGSPVDRFNPASLSVRLKRSHWEYVTDKEFAVMFMIKIKKVKK